MRSGLDSSREISLNHIYRDVGSFGQRTRKFLSNGENAALLMGGLAGVAFIMPAISELAFAGALGIGAYSMGVQRKNGLPMQVPMSANTLDPKEINLATKKADKGKGIVYIGNDQKTNEEIWLTDTQARTHMMFLGTTGSGKALQMDEPILTPGGFKLNRDIKVGDYVIHRSGKPTKAIGVFPQGSLELYRISFCDGRFMDVSGDHLWEVHHKHWNGKYKEGISRAGMARPRVMTTCEIMEKMSVNNGTFSIPLYEPDFNSPRSEDLPVSPYLLGALLGDGGLGEKTLTFTSIDEPLLERVRSDLSQYGMTLKHYPSNSYCSFNIVSRDGDKRLNHERKTEFRVILENLGLTGKRSEEKFIPDCYLSASPADRIELLRGLMDTDGTAGKAGGVSFSTSSKQLAEDVRRLVQSIGGIAKIATKKPTYTHKGVKKNGRASFNISLRVKNPSSLFELSRKNERVENYQYSESLKLKIQSVEKLEKSAECQCIKVEADDGLFVAGDYIVTHNTEFLISVAFNALVHGSGLIYVDGKADNSLYGKLYSMARFMGREDDVLLINFQTGAKDVFGAQPRKMSNTLNPFAVGSSGMLTQLVVGLMSGGKEGGKSDVWENRAISFVEALLKPLVYLRDHYGLLLDVEIIRNYFNLEPLAALLTDNMEKTKNDFNADVWVEKKNPRFPGIGYALSGLAAYMDNLPGINWAKPMAKQESVVSEQHGYITMQLIRTFNSLSDTYGYIMKTPLAEIDFLDVFINRRILVVLLPALEKSPPELTNLGRIIVASIKSVMAVGLGADVEGDWAKVIDAKPTTSPSPYMCILDEYGYYAVEGFAVVPAQARSLGFSAIFAGQDLPAFEKASKPEAESTLANTTTKFCGKLECTKTFEYFKSVAGEAFYSRTGGFNNTATSILSHAYLDNQSAQIEKMSRISDMDLRSQISGEWHMFFADRIVRINSFFSNPKKVKKLRTNHFVPVAPPSDEVARKLNEIKARLVDQLGKGFATETPEGVRYALNDATTSKFNAYVSALEHPSEEIKALSGFDRTLKEVEAMLREMLTKSAGLTGDFERDLGGAEDEEEALPDDFMERMDRSGRRSSIDDFADMDEEDDPLGDMEFDEDSAEVDFSAHVSQADPANVLFNDGADDDRAEDRLSGLLDRDRMHAGLSSIEAQLGRPKQVSEVIASEVAFEMSASTHYPSAPLAEEPDLEDFFEVSNLLQSELRDHAEGEGK